MGDVASYVAPSRLRWAGHDYRVAIHALSLHWTSDPRSTAIRSRLCLHGKSVDCDDSVYGRYRSLGQQSVSGRYTRRSVKALMGLSKGKNLGLCFHSFWLTNKRSFVSHVKLVSIDWVSSAAAP